MIQSNKILILFCLSFVFSKAFIPDNGSSFIIQKDEKEYIYYQFKKEGLHYTNLGDEYSKGDSVRIKFLIRLITPSESKGKQDFKIKLELNNKSPRSLRYIKPKSKLNIKGRPGWSLTQYGVWFIDILPEDLKKIKISGDKKVIVRAQIDKINREKYSSYKSLNSINKETKFIIDTKQDKDKIKDSYKI